MEELNDDMLRRAVRGDWAAFGQLVKHYERLIYSIAYHYLGNAQDAEDISQEVLMKIYNNLHKCHNVRALKNWVCTITNNTCIDYIRRMKNRRADSYDAYRETMGDGLVPQMESPEATPEEAFLSAEKRGQIRKAISMLSLDQRSLIVLRDIKGFSYEELAEITKTNMGTVKSRLSRARRNLKVLLDKIVEHKD